MKKTLANKEVNKEANKEVRIEGIIAMKKADLKKMSLNELSDILDFASDNLKDIKDAKNKKALKSRISWIDELIEAKEDNKDIDTSQLAMNIINETAVTTDSKPGIKDQDKEAKKKTDKKTKKKDQDKEAKKTDKKEVKKDFKKDLARLTYTQLYKDYVDHFKEITPEDLLKAYEDHKTVYLRLEDDLLYKIAYLNQDENTLVLIQRTAVKGDKDVVSLIFTGTVNKMSKGVVILRDEKFNSDVYDILNVYVQE